MEGVDPRLSPRAFNYSTGPPRDTASPPPGMDNNATSHSCPELFTRSGSNPSIKPFYTEQPRRANAYQEYLQQQQQYLHQQQLLLQQQQIHWQQRQQIIQHKQQQLQKQQVKQQKMAKQAQVFQQRQDAMRSKLSKSVDVDNNGSRAKPKLSLPLSQSQPPFQQQHGRQTALPSGPSPLQSPHTSSSAPDLRSLGPVGAPVNHSYSLPLHPALVYPIGAQTHPKTKSSPVQGKPYNAAQGYRKGQDPLNAGNGYRPRSFSSNGAYLVGERPLSLNADESGETSSASEEEVLDTDLPTLNPSVEAVRKCVDSEKSRTRTRSAESPTTAATKDFKTAADDSAVANKQRRSSLSPRSYAWGNQRAPKEDATDDETEEGDCSPPPGLGARNPKDGQHKVRVRQASSANASPTQKSAKSPIVRTPRKEGAEQKSDEASPSTPSAAPVPAPVKDFSQFELNLDAIRKGEEVRASLMIKNIPNKYNQEMLLETINKNFKGSYDFFYLPIDFKNKCNVGYAFINFISVSSVVPFFLEFNEKKWEKFNSSKICKITWARIQGKNNFIEHFRNSSLMHEDPKCRPLIFKSSGEGVGQQETFPAPTMTPHKGSPSKPGHSANGENGTQ